MMPPSEEAETLPPSAAPPARTAPSPEPVEGVGDGVGERDAGDAVAVGVVGGRFEADGTALAEAPAEGVMVGVRELLGVIEPLLEIEGVALPDSVAPMDMDEVGVPLGVGLGVLVLVAEAVGVVEGVDVCVTAVGSTAQGVPTKP